MIATIVTLEKRKHDLNDAQLAHCCATNIANPWILLTHRGMRTKGVRQDEGVVMNEKLATDKRVPFAEVITSASFAVLVIWILPNLVL